MDVTSESDDDVNQDVTMNDVTNETALKICTTKYNKKSGLKNISDNGKNIEKNSAEVLILIPNTDVSSNRKKEALRTLKVNYYSAS